MAQFLSRVQDGFTWLFILYFAGLLVGLCMFGCGAPTDTAPRDLPQQGEVLDLLPMCKDSPPPSAKLHQEMRFGERIGFGAEGWCAFWAL